MGAATSAVPPPSHYDAPPTAEHVIAVGRRRAARAAESSRKASRVEREKEVVIRLAARALRHGYAFTLLQLDYRYWQARACGWDVATKGFAVNAAGDSCDPAASATWLWWVGLHWRQRGQIRAASVFSRHHH